MRNVKLSEAKDRLSELVSAAEAGEDIAITRHGRAVVRLVAIEEDRMAQQRAAIDEMFALGKEMRAKYGPFSIDEIISWKNEGRR